MASPSQSDSDRISVLLTLFQNHSENIENTKRRTFALIAGYTAVAGFLLSYEEKIAVGNGLFLFIFSIFTGLCFHGVYDNRKHLIRRREKLKYLHKKLRIYPFPTKNDQFITIAQLIYLATIQILVVAYYA